MSEFVLNPARHGPFPGRLAPETIAAYAAATGDHTAAVLDGRAVPAVFPVILIFTPEEAARADVPEGVWQHVRGGVHGEHDIVVHRPLVPGERLDTSAWLSAVRTTRAGTQIVVQFEQVGADGAVAVEQWWTMVLLGLHGVADLGTMPADHRFPEDARAHPLGSVSQHVDKDIAHRYAEVSGDWAAHHFDIAVARARRVSTSCSPTDCARWRSAHTDCSACWASRTRPWSGASPSGSRHRPRWTPS
jgi:acyl dehydratase